MSGDGRWIPLTFKRRPSIILLKRIAVVVVEYANPTWQWFENLSSCHVNRASNDRQATLQRKTCQGVVVGHFLYCHWRYVHRSTDLKSSSMRQWRFCRTVSTVETCNVNWRRCTPTAPSVSTTAVAVGLLSWKTVSRTRLSTQALPNRVSSSLWNDITLTVLETRCHRHSSLHTVIVILVVVSSVTLLF